MADPDTAALVARLRNWAVDRDEMYELKVEQGPIVESRQGAKLLRAAADALEALTAERDALKQLLHIGSLTADEFAARYVGPHSYLERMERAETERDALKAALNVELARQPPEGYT